ncbi:MAG: UDP-N-acetylglucosamine 1-carboxyvinyltransferase [Defluviitaleaceae bacterium]|nr:UDP-N-acetylglucosamine 1-carboxyvinyltransferase [Defluviitaleaceae bacterium]
MEHIIISGNKPLKGRVDISGAKNAAVAIIPATLCAGGVHTIENLPQIEDVRNYITVLESMGASCEFLDDHTMRVDARNVSSTVNMPENLKGMRASYYLIGSLLGRFKKAVVPMPGGCNFGSRPIDQHIKGFEALGAEVIQEHGSIFVTAERLVGTKIYLDVASVGATINIMMAAVYAEGETILENCAKEPHIVDCANFLNMCGANIKGAGTGVMRITGVTPTDMKDRDYTIIPDQIEAGTYMIAAAVTGGEVTVRRVIPKHMEALSAKLQEMGCDVFAGDDWIKVRGKEELKPTTVTTLYYPGFPTDLQPQMTALLTQGNGTSYVTETVFENRFQYIDQLARLGAKVKIEGRMAVIEGQARLTGADVTATDLRAGACLVVAALAAEGNTQISNVHYIDRGYENLEEKLTALGANIRRISDGEPPLVALEA